MSIKTLGPYPARFFLLSAILFLIPWTTSDTRAGLSVQVNFTEIQLFHLGDFGMVSSGATDRVNLARDPEIFNFSLSSTEYPVTVQLQLQISSTRLGVIATGTSRAVQLTEPVIGLTNRDLTSSENPFKLQNYEMILSEGDLRQHLGTGLLPADEYRFELTAVEVGNPSNRMENVSIVNITNPTTLNLRSPGSDPSRVEDDVRQVPSPVRPPYDPNFDPAAPLDEPDGYISVEDWMDDGRAVLYTTEPMFYWDSQALDFSIIIWEKTDNLIRDNADVESVVQATPFFRQDGITSTVFQFPASGGARGPMREGGIYYYQVIANIPSSRGTFTVESEIYGFCIADPTIIPGAGGATATASTASPGSATLRSDLLAVIRDLTGRDLTQTLSGWSPTGVILIDGQAATVNQLRSLRGRIKIKDVIVK